MFLFFYKLHQWKSQLPLTDLNPIGKSSEVRVVHVVEVHRVGVVARELPSFESLLDFRAAPDGHQQVHQEHHHHQGWGQTTAMQQAKT